MPTGYTCNIKDGITFQQFAMNCARAFGALVHMRDSGGDAEIPETIEPSDYHPTRIAADEKESRRLADMSTKDADAAAQADYEQRLQYDRGREEETDDQRTKYQAMLDTVRAWQPPTDEHAGLKRFMVDQIAESMRYDCGERAPRVVERRSGEEWVMEKKAMVATSLAYHHEENAKEVKRCNEKTEWVRALRESLETKEPTTPK